MLEKFLHQVMGRLIHLVPFVTLSLLLTLSFTPSPTYAARNEIAGRVIGNTAYLEEAVAPAHSAVSPISQDPGEKPSWTRSMRFWRVEDPYLDFGPLPKSLLPDLKTLPPSDLRLVVSRGGERKILRFTNSIFNDGYGDVELRGRYEPQDKSFLVSQVIYWTDETELLIESGELIFHPEHNHWHWMNFSLYEIWSIHADGKLDELLVSSSKISYCLRDDRRAPAEGDSLARPNNPYRKDRPGFVTCGWRGQGISVGWTDVYGHDTPGQDIDISELPDGTYALKSTVNPDRILYEANTANNIGITYFHLEKSTIKTLGSDLSPEN